MCVFVCVRLYICLSVCLFKSACLCVMRYVRGRDAWDKTDRKVNYESVAKQMRFRGIHALNTQTLEYI